MVSETALCGISCKTADAGFAGLGTTSCLAVEAISHLVAHNRNLLQIFQKETEEEQADFLLENFRPVGSSVLDVGCGTGALARLMKQRRPELDFILLNRSWTQLEMCPPEMDRVLEDAHNVPLRDAIIDNVMACYVMGHLHKDQALKEFMRVLRPGGVLFIYDLTGGEMPELDYVVHSEPTRLFAVAADSTGRAELMELVCAEQ